MFIAASQHERGLVSNPKIHLKGVDGECDADTTPAVQVHAEITAKCGVDRKSDGTNGAMGGCCVEENCD